MLQRLIRFSDSALIIGPFELRILPGCNSSSTSNSSLPVAMTAILGRCVTGTLE